MRDFVEIVEVGPRDGLQNEPRPIATAEKIALIDRLSQAGFRRIEAASFVRPDLVPQMADGAAVLAGIGRPPGVRHVVLTPNNRGYRLARAAGADAVAVIVAASEGFSRANTNTSVAASIAAAKHIVAKALSEDVQVRAYVSCAVDCPYDGPTAPARVSEIAAELHGMGCGEIVLADTLGRGRPERVERLLEAVLPAVPAQHIAGHFHDTGGWALQNVAVALAAGVRIFDSAVGGLGGCPFAPGAAGNLATESLLRFLSALGFETGLDRAIVDQAGDHARLMRERVRGASTP